MKNFYTRKLCLEILEDRLPPNCLFSLLHALPGAVTPLRLLNGLAVQSRVPEDAASAASVSALRPTGDAGFVPRTTARATDDRSVGFGENSTEDVARSRALDVLLAEWPGDESSRPLAGPSADTTMSPLISLGGSQSSGCLSLLSDAKGPGAWVGGFAAQSATAPTAQQTFAFTQALAAQSGNPTPSALGLPSGSAEPSPVQGGTGSVAASPILSTAPPGIEAGNLPHDYLGNTSANALVVQLRSNQADSLTRLQSLLQPFGATISAAPVAGFALVRSTPASQPAIQALLASQPTVISAQQLAFPQLASTPDNPSFTSGSQYGLNGTYGINAPQAWSVTTGSRSTIVADIDTGIDYTHPDLYQNIWINQKEIPPSRMKNLTDVYGDGYISMRDLNNPINQGPGKITDINHHGYIDASDLLALMGKNPDGTDNGTGGWADGISQDNSGYLDDIVGWNFADHNNNPFDKGVSSEVGHGTHTAGIIGAMGISTAAQATVGVNWRVQIMPLQLFHDSQNGGDTGAALAIQYANSHGARVANASWATMAS